MSFSFKPLTTEGAIKRKEGEWLEVWWWTKLYYLDSSNVVLKYACFFSFVSLSLSFHFSIICVFQFLSSVSNVIDMTKPADKETLLFQRIIHLRLCLIICSWEELNFVLFTRFIPSLSMSRLIFLIHTLSPCSLVIPGYKYFFLLLLSLLLCFYSYSLPVKILPSSSLSPSPSLFPSLFIPVLTMDFPASSHIILSSFVSSLFFSTPFPCVKEERKALRISGFLPK